MVCVCVGYVCLCHDLQKRLYRSRNHSGLDLHGPKEFRIPATLFIADNRVHGACADDEALPPLLKNWRQTARLGNAHCAGKIRLFMGLLQLLFELDSSTIRVRFEHATTSYEELCAFEQ